MLLELYKTKLLESSMDAEVAPPGELAMLVYAPCADCRTSCPLLVKFSMASAGTGGLSLLAVQTTVF